MLPILSKIKLFCYQFYATNFFLQTGRFNVILFFSLHVRGLRKLSVVKLFMTNAMKLLRPAPHSALLMSKALAFGMIRCISSFSYYWSQRSKQLFTNGIQLDWFILLSCRFSCFGLVLRVVPVPNLRAKAHRPHRNPTS